MDPLKVFHARPDAPRALTESELRVAFRLGVLPALVTRTVCHGYQNCCVCPDCLSVAQQGAERGFSKDGRINPPEAPRQPWEIAA